MSRQYLTKGDRETGPPDLFVATTSGSTPKQNYVVALTDTVAKLATAGVVVDWLLHHGDPHVDDARNACVAMFLESGAKKLLFIDDDVGWIAEEFIKFIKHDRDVVAAIYPMKSDETEYPVRLIAGPLQAEPDGLVQVDNVPTGFLMISRACIDAMLDSAAWFKRKDSGQTPLLFERGVDNASGENLRWGGDYWWGRKWTKMGGKVWVDPEMNLSHVGLKTWDGCIGDHWRLKNGIIDPYLDGAFKLLQSGVVKPDIWTVLSGRSGNYPWCAPEEMMARCYEMAKAAHGPVLECGSGLTTIIMGMAGAEVHSLEHDYGWFKKTQKLIERYGLSNVTLHYAPIMEYVTDVAWYKVPHKIRRLQFDLVVCDGPPRNVADRAGLWHLISYAIESADWIIDDVDGDASRYEQDGRIAEIIGRFAVVRKPDHGIKHLRRA